MGFKLSENEKSKRVKEINSFSKDFGRGDEGLSESQKRERIKKVLGSEVEKLKGFGKNKNKGVELKDLSCKSMTRPDDGRDRLKNVLNNIDDYPDDPYLLSKNKTSKVVNCKIKDNGRLEIDGIHLNGKENDVRTRATWGQVSVSDEEAAKAEKKQYEKGVLREVSDRTMKIHKDNNDLETFFDDDKIDTDKDKDKQY